MRLPALLSIPVFTAAVLVVLWLARGLEQAAPMPETDAADQARYELVGARWTRLDAKGQPQFTAQSDKLRWFDDRSAEMINPRISALGGAGSPWELHSPLGHMSPRSDDVVLTEPVIGNGRAPDGEALRLETKQLTIATRQKQLQTTLPVSLTGATRHVRAVGMNADWNGKTLKLLNDVEVHYVRAR